MSHNNSTSDRPVIAEGDHPVESTRYLFETPAIESLYDQVKSWIINRIPGAIIYAPPRTGKTKAIKMLVSEIARSFPGMPVVVLPVFHGSTPSPIVFLETLLREAGHAIIATGSGEDKLLRFSDFIAQAADESRQYRAVLILDEAQELVSFHYKWLIGIHNRLDLSEINLITLLVGQEELLTIRSEHIAAKNDHIVGRFMTHTYEFSGIRNNREVKECLGAYDDILEYPKDSGWSFTRFYLPKWYDNGGRIKEFADEFWEEISIAHKKKYPRKKPQISMQYFVRAVDHFLRITSEYQQLNNKTKNNKNYDLAQPNDVRNAIDAALSAAEYVNSLTIHDAPTGHISPQ